MMEIIKMNNYYNFLPACNFAGWAWGFLYNIKHNFLPETCLLHYPEFRYDKGCLCVRPDLVVLVLCYHYVHEVQFHMSNIHRHNLGCFWTMKTTEGFGTCVYLGRFGKFITFRLGIQSQSFQDCNKIILTHFPSAYFQPSVLGNTYTLSHLHTMDNLISLDYHFFIHSADIQVWCEHFSLA